MELTCSICRAQACREAPGVKPPPVFCPATETSDALSEARQIYHSDPKSRQLSLAAAQVEAAGYCHWPRVQEVMEFARRIGATHLGIATCIGLIREANLLQEILEANGFQVSSVCCKVGSIVLGLNDALMELTGALAGLTLALQDTRLIALSGAITGIAAALSMAASEYLSTKSEETTKEPLKASAYTGVAYIVTVSILIWPYLFLDNFYVCLGWALTAAVLIIALFNYYISVVKDEPFRKRFLEMAGVSLGVAGLSFLVGYVVRTVLGVEI